MDVGVVENEVVVVRCQEIETVVEIGNKVYEASVILVEDALCH